MAAAAGLNAAFKLKGHQAAVLSCASLGALLASGDEDGRLIIHDLRRAATSSAAADAGTFAASGAEASATAGASASASVSLTSPAAEGSKPLISVTLKGADGQPAPITALAVIPSSSTSSSTSAAAAGAADGGGDAIGGLFAAAGSLVHQIDVRAPGSVVQTYDSAREEVNGLAVNCRGTYLAAGDDGGEVQVYDLAAGKQYKGIRNVHRSICSSVAFRAHKPWDLLSGGLDSSVAKYDFSRPKCIDRWDMAALAAQPGAGGGGGGQIFNPPFVHQVAVPAGEARPGCGWLAAARGDGAVVVLDADVSSAVSASSGPTSVLAAAGGGGGGGRKGGGGSGGGAGKGKGKGGGGGSGGGGVMLPLVLDRDVGGHTLPVCSVAWSPGAAAAAADALLAAATATAASAAPPAELTEPATPAATSSCRLYSGGEDARVVVWDVGAALSARASGRPLVPPPWQPRPPAPSAAAGDDADSSGAAGPGTAGGTGGDGTDDGQAGAVAVLAEVSHGRKVNQLCALGLDGKELVAVAAVSKFVVLYELRIGRS
ncbi:hypothetical protein HYH02_002049 [Chlamydomonas schloesseri]|uniref:Uncharacterized protein n=1 Tax=Chlamydomonas schloesseri TaxID=2026947 RepID=A0A835WUV4_9CHLO|nr:hypothetical protein HYH02_002049 [Chlamydomonas schloesseri]|eukprot:KAG2453842.1 hypothetical protein HYH02_002049 [Chlamydomonas schloesseri]